MIRILRVVSHSSNMLIFLFGLCCLQYCIKIILVTGIPGESSDGKTGAAAVVGAVVAVLVIIIIIIVLFIVCLM